MSKSSRSMIRILAFGVIVLTATSWAQERSPIIEKMAKTYGVDSWDTIEAIRYTWSGEIPGLFKLSRTWEWEPKTNKVTYLRSELSSQSDDVKNQIDPAFVNDNYWTLFPLHAYWDKSASAIDQGMMNLPLGSGTAELIPVKYPGDSGYTPGDTWDLYIGKDNRVVFFDYHRGGAKPPSLSLIHI